MLPANNAVQRRASLPQTCGTLKSVTVELNGDTIMYFIKTQEWQSIQQSR